jgi:hypothetical protein
MPRTIGNPHGWPDYTWPMVWVLQDADLWPIEQWVAHQGQEKLWHDMANLAAGFSQTSPLYTVPVGHKLYVVSYLVSGEQNALFRLRRDAGAVYYADLYTMGRYPVPIYFRPPVVLTAGQVLESNIVNQGAAAGIFIAVVQGFDLVL